ncbi:MAG: hypothetical protein WAK18_07860 [Nocardioidaceae bacterium]
MTSTQHGPGGNEPMELDETMLHQRFDVAVGDVRPDVVAIVGAGEQHGHVLRRRRRWQAGGSALAVLALVAGGAYVSGADVFDQRSAQPTDPSPTTSQQLVDATPRGAAAALLDLADLGTPTDVGGERQQGPDGSPDETLQVGAAYRVDGQRLSVEVIATRPVTQWKQAGTCANAQTGGGQDAVWCDDSPLSDGTPALRILMSAADSSSSDSTATPDSTGASATTYLAIVAVKRDGQLVAVIETLPPDVGQPAYTQDNLPVSIESLTALATDPRIGFSTTQDYNTAGEQLSDFRSSFFSSSSGSGSSSGTSSAEKPAASEGAATNSGGGSAGEQPDIPTVTVTEQRSTSSSGSDSGSAGAPGSTP